MSNPFRVAILVPHFNHHRQFEPTLKRLTRLDLPLIVVDDGSSEESRSAIERLLADVPRVSLVAHPFNQGKGGAMMTGLQTARSAGYSHVIQVDADGQHTLEDIPKLLEVAREQPRAIVSAKPVFAADIPTARLLGRRLTHFWVALETWSGRIPDAMCGLRVYPLAPVCHLIENHRIGPRMQFDIEILVRADWAGIPIRYVPSPVHYPETGLSHFHLLRDNLGITAMHTRLMLGMVPRIPMLLWRQIRSFRGDSE